MDPTNEKTKPVKKKASQNPNSQVPIPIMQIFVGNTAYDVDSSTSVEALKLQIENNEFVPAGMISLVNGSDVLVDGSLESHGIEEDDTLEMRMAVQSGMRKKWRKKRMRRLRRKRRKMRQRGHR